MNEQELVGNIVAELRTQGFFQRENYCKVSHKEEARSIIRLFKQANYVRLADDQSLPEWCRVSIDSPSRCVQKMQGANFVRVIKEEEK